MSAYRHLTLSGDLGSGKTSVARGLKDELNMTVFSTGEMHRQIAAELGQSALEANRTAEVDESIDRRIDGLAAELGRGPVDTIFDSRMAWHMVDDALKVHLLVDPEEAARRVLRRTATPVESYASLRQATEGLKERSSVERRRFHSKYDVDILALRNYDVVVDTTGVGVAQIVDLVAAEFRQGHRTRQRIWLDPQRVIDRSTFRFPNAIRRFTDEVSSHSEPGQLNVFYAAPKFVILRPEDAEVLHRLLASKGQLVSANLLSDGVDAKDEGVYLARILGTCEPQLEIAALRVRA